MRYQTKDIQQQLLTVRGTAEAVIGDRTRHGSAYVQLMYAADGPRWLR